MQFQLLLQQQQQQNSVTFECVWLMNEISNTVAETKTKTIE